ncbi:MAG: hypothetical protein HYS09_06070 [Chloroflexi bacterium]|nr:hypothetical protein [Chloroflexota bacterium]
MKRRPVGNEDSQRGQVLILAILGMGLLMGFVALAVDVGMFMHERRALQNAADAAALAGAYELPDDPESADEQARAWAAGNGIAPEEIESVEVTTTYAADDTVVVNVTREVGFIFARVLGLTSGTVKATATAVIGTAGGMDGVSPFSVEDSVFQNLDPGDTTTLKYNATNPTDGNFLPLLLDAPGAQEYEDNIEEGSQSYLCAQGQERDNCSSTTDTQTGNMVGPTRDGIRWLINNTSDDCDTFDEVFSVSPADADKYVLNFGCDRFRNPDAASYRVIVVPVIDSLCNGQCEVDVLRFALFFIEGLNCGGGGGGGQGGGQGGGGGGQGNTCEVTGRYVEARLDIGAFVAPYDVSGSLTFVRLIE